MNTCKRLTQSHQLHVEDIFLMSRINVQISSSEGKTVLVLEESQDVNIQRPNVDLQQTEQASKGRNLFMDSFSILGETQNLVNILFTCCDAVILEDYNLCR